ncbi:ATP-binding protein [Desulfoferrobacter suflitae]|uniref:ATP-binding protein n=1 Tax=Desulfoferrobacter suflitae TaxID=2865782 RepID=UPI002164E7EC|nr:ATP-binding protein [Desulfoferrobacter suflitae]MCK8602506.1 ATP-binding protein [Desulfoferrobacter suflitae]
MDNLFNSKMKLLGFFWSFLLAVLLLVCWFYYRNLKQEISAEAHKNAIQNLELIHGMLQRDADINDQQALQRYLRRIGSRMSFRITYVARGGMVIADSQVPLSSLASLDNHAVRPEIVAAQEQEVGLSTRYSRTSQQELIYVAKAIQPSGGIPPGVLRLAVPWSDFRARFDRYSRTFVWVMLLAFAIIALLSYLLTRQLDKPVNTMIAAMNAIGEGNYGQRLHFQPGHEFYSLAGSINAMADMISRQIHTITGQKQQLEAVFHGMKEGVMVLDAQGKLSGVNRAMAEIIPNVSQSIGRRPLEATMSLELQRACDYVLSPSSDLDSYPYMLQITLHAGENIYDVNIVRLQDPQGGIGAIVVFHDISELKRLEKVRQDFVANVSHELRTPLTSIKGYAETLLAEHEQGPQPLASFLSVILKNTNHMVKMVDDLLQLARLEARSHLEGAAAVNAAEALAAAWKACEPLAQSKQVRLTHSLPAEGLQVTVDFDQLVQVFRNLLENAVRYSPTGEIIEVGYTDDPKKVTFSVRDDGPGIPGQHQHRVFERFYRVEKHRGAQPGSTGLGLSICRHIIQNNGGRIWVKSPVDFQENGTIFYFTLFH